MAEKRIYEVQYVEGLIAENERLTKYCEDQCVDTSQHNAIVKQKNDEIERLTAENARLDESYIARFEAWEALEQQNTRLRGLLQEVHDWQWDHKQTYRNIESAVDDLGLIIARITQALTEVEK